MSLEQSIADLTTEAGKLMDLPQSIATAATQQITAIGNAYQARLNGLQGTFYVDAVNGADNAPGSIDAPLKSIQRALTLIPRGGVCTVILKSDYTMTTASRITIDGRRLILLSDSEAVRRNLFFERGVNDNIRYLAGFIISNGGAITVRGLTLNMPPLDGGWPALTPARSGMFMSPAVIGWETASIVVSYCDVVIPATPFGYFLSALMNPALVWYSNTLTGATASILGRMSADQPNTAGVATNTLPWLQTNLTNI